LGHNIILVNFIFYMNWCICSFLKLKIKSVKTRPQIFSKLHYFSFFRNIKAKRYIQADMSMTIN